MSSDQSLLSIVTSLGEGALRLREAKLTEKLGCPFEIVVDLVSDDEYVKLEELLGTNATIRLETENGSRFFNGVITEFSQKDNLDKNAYYSATLRPWFWLLSLTQNCRIFQNKSYIDIIKEVFDSLGFSDYEFKLNATYKPMEYVVQFNESDLNFVSRLLQKEGIFYYFKHINGKHTMVLVDDSNQLPDIGEVEYFELEDESKHIGVEGIMHWQHKRRVKTGAIRTTDYDFIKPNKNLKALTADATTSSLSAFEKYSYPGKYLERNNGTNYTKILMQKENAGYETKKLKGNSRILYAGSIFKLTDYPRDDQNAKHLVTEFSCIMRADAFMADRTGQDKTFFDFTAYAIPVKTVFRSELNAKKPVMTGPQTATVVGKAGEEIWTDKYGRIKVFFHWDKQSEANEESSCWIRVAQSIAGKNWGSMYIPRIGQEVLVDFLDGDPDRPIVAGCIYNGTTMPPYELPANATMSGFKSRSSKGGGGFNELRFEDKKGEEQIYIHGERNRDTRIKNDSFETIGNDKHTTIKNDSFHNTDNDRTENVGRDHIENIDRDRNLNVKGKESKFVGNTLSLSVKNDVSEVFSKNHSMTVDKDSYISATNICLEASSNITLKVGGTSIALESGGVAIKTGGNIELNATGQITLKGKANAELSSSGPTVIKGVVVKVN